MSSLTKFATETAKLMKEFSNMTKEDEEARQEFCSELAESSEEQQEVLKLLFEQAKAEMSKLRRAEKSSSKSDAKTDGNDVAKKMTKGEQIEYLLMSGQAISKKEIQEHVSCDRKTVDRAIKKIEKKGKVITTTEDGRIEIAVYA
jgi:biotin operon repressor